MLQNLHFIEGLALITIAQLLELRRGHAGDFFELPTQVGDTAVAEPVGYFGQRKFIINQ